jgi:hypothetical protein
MIRLLFHPHLLNSIAILPLATPLDVDGLVKVGREIRHRELVCPRLACHRIDRIPPHITDVDEYFHEFWSSCVYEVERGAVGDVQEPR